MIELYNPYLGFPVQTPKTEVQRVNGLNGANALQMPPDSSGLFLDLNDPIVWLVQTDSAGYKTCTPFDIIPHQTPKPVTDVDIQSLVEKINGLEERMIAYESNSGDAVKEPTVNRDQQPNREDKMRKRSAVADH